MPIGIGAAMLGGSLLSAGTSLFGSNKQSDAVAKAQQAAIAEQRAAREQVRGDLAPWRTTGENALLNVGNLSGVNGPDAAQQAMGGFTSSPGYQFQMHEGLNAIDAGASARGMLASGQTQKAEMQYAQGLASQDFDHYYNRLLGLAQGGQNAAATQGAATQNAANQISQTQASGATAQADIYGNMSQGVGNAIGGGLNNYAYQQGLQQQNALMNGNYSQGAGGYAQNAAGPYLGAPRVQKF
jgi:hypothetical protein